MTTVYAVASAKGGVGKTTTTAAIATILADSGADVVAIDADIGMANLAAAVGVTPGETTLHDVLSGEAAPLDAVHEGPAGLRVVPGAADLDAYAAADPSVLGEVMSAFDDADYVFVDAGAGLSHDSTLPLGLADETLLVSTTDRSALGDTEKTRQLTERLGGTVAGAAITRVRSDTAADEADEADGADEADEANGADAVAELLDAPVLGRIPEDESVVRAAEAGEPLLTFAPDAPATRGYRDLTRALTDADIAGDGVGAGGDGADDTGGDGADEETDDADETSDTATGVDAEEAPDEAGTESAEGDEDIIVADSERAGLGEPGDESEIIVADESPASTDEGVDESDGDGSEGEASTAPSEPERGVVDETEVADETELVGEEHVDGDDLEAMIAEDVDEAAAFDDETAAFDGETAEADEAATGSDGADTESDVASSDSETAEEDSAADDGDIITDADEVASRAGDSDREATAFDDEETSIDDELAGSIPFRDDDTGTMNTEFTDEGETGDGSDDGDKSDDSGSGRSDDGKDRGDDGKDRGDDDGDEGDDQKSGGFLSRLFGR